MALLLSEFSPPRPSPSAALETRCGWSSFLVGSFGGFVRQFRRRLACFFGGLFRRFRV